MVSYFSGAHYSIVAPYRLNYSTLLSIVDPSLYSFHYVSPNEMYVYEYLIYHLRPFGVGSHHKPEDIMKL